MARPSDLENRLLTYEEAGKVLALSAQSLRAMKCRGEGPPYLKFGRAVRFQYAALMEWVRIETRAAKRRADEAKARQDEAAAHAPQ